MSAAGLIPCGCCGCTNGTECETRVKTWCTGAKYSHDQIVCNGEFTVSSTGEVLGYESDWHADITTAASATFAIDVKRLNREISETYYVETVNDGVPLTLLENTYSGPSSASDKTPIGSTLPSGVSFSASVTPGLTVTSSASGPSSVTPTVIREFASLGIEVNYEPTGGGFPSFGVQATVTAYKDVLYVGSNTSWFVLRHGFGAVFQVFRTPDEDDKTDYCAGTPVTSSGGTVSLISYSDGLNEFDVLQGNMDNSDEFGFITGETGTATTDYDIDLSITRLDTDAERGAHTCADCLPAFALNVTKLEDIDQGTEGSPLIPAEPKYTTYTATALTFRSNETTACGMPANQCSWSSTSTGALKTLDNGDTVAGSLGVTVNRYTGYGTLAWTPSGGSATTLFTVNAPCPGAGIIADTIFETRVTNPYRVIEDGGYEGDTLEIDEAVVVSSATGDYTVDEGICEPICGGLADDYVSSILCGDGDPPDGAVMIELVQSETPCQLVGDNGTYSDLLEWEDGTWTETVTRNSDSVVVFTATWTGESDDPTGTHPFNASIWDEDPCTGEPGSLRSEIS